MKASIGNNIDENRNDTMLRRHQDGHVYDRVFLLWCRLPELCQSLQLYRLNPDIKLKPPYAQLESSQRTFESSNYRLLVDAVKSIHMEQKKAAWLILRAVEELIKIYAPETWAKSFVTELVQAKKHKGGDIGTMAQYLCKCGCGV